MKVEAIKNRALRRVAIVAVLAVWGVTFAGYAIAMVFEEAYWGALLGVRVLRREWQDRKNTLRRNLGKIW